MKRLTFPADPIVVEVERYPAGGGQSDMLDVTIRRGGIYLGNVETFRDDKLPTLRTFDLSPGEKWTIQGGIMSEWAQWPEDNTDPEPLDMYEELCRIVDEYRARNASEGGV